MSYVSNQLRQPSFTASSPSSSRMLLKILYTFDDKTTFLARSTSQVPVRVIPMSIPNMKEQVMIGAYDLKKCVELIVNSSPEYFQTNTDFALYSRDVSEMEEPLVGHGLMSKLFAKKSYKHGDILVSGRVCQSFASIFNNSSASSTLEVRLRITPVRSAAPVGQSPVDGSSVDSPESFQNQRHQIYENSPEIEDPSDKQKKKLLARVGPVKAARTQSLPYFGDNIAVRIMQADQNNASSSTANNVADRFSGFEKLLSIKPKPDAQKKGSSSRTKSTSPPKCVNCTCTESRSWKYYKEGIFEFGNSGLLCHDCNVLHLKNDLAGLRKKGKMASAGLLDDAYRKHAPKKRQNDDLPTPPIAKFRGAGKRAKSIYDPLSSSSMMNSSSPMLQNQSSEDDMLKFQQNPLTDIDPLPSNRRSSVRCDSIQDDNASDRTMDHDDENRPLDAMKLNTTLINFDVDDVSNKENQQPDQPFMIHGHEITPTLNRILQSIGEVSPGSPSRRGNQENSPNSWLNLFTHREEDEEDDDNFARPSAPPKLDLRAEMVSNSNAVNTEKTPLDRFDITPKDIETGQTMPCSTTPSASTNTDIKRINMASMPSSPFFTVQSDDDPRHQEGGQSHMGLLSSNGKLDPIENWSQFSSPATEQSHHPQK
ncbi:unnamed protein product [Kuraishia capsulata CBS 1993]|uniref:Ams2/SPT21 N-terminal domain-containing protein n=1 Tax=Kuraishia capsulata CBS 1993 TaxID=1382522 RepID=W6MRS3_9ASCO|nr:uncharacterized protein KUCA_T00005407001 [Kuraishia capsulata CBS 1993]CDK29419.1 unnamed protein product [Kuraishia capsulata CBS 1993]